MSFDSIYVVLIFNLYIITSFGLGNFKPRHTPLLSTNIPPESSPVVSAVLLECPKDTPRTTCKPRTEGSMRPKCEQQLMVNIRVNPSFHIEKVDKFLILDEVYDPRKRTKAKIMSPYLIEISRGEPIMMYPLEFSKSVKAGGLKSSYSDLNNNPADGICSINRHHLNQNVNKNKNCNINNEVNKPYPKEKPKFKMGSSEFIPELKSSSLKMPEPQKVLNFNGNKLEQSKQEPIEPRQMINFNGNNFEQSQPLETKQMKKFNGNKFEQSQQESMDRVMNKITSAFGTITKLNSGIDAKHQTNWKEVQNNRNAMEEPSTDQTSNLNEAKFISRDYDADEGDDDEQWQKQNPKDNANKKRRVPTIENTNEQFADSKQKNLPDYNNNFARHNEEDCQQETTGNVGVQGKLMKRLERCGKIAQLGLVRTKPKVILTEVDEGDWSGKVRTRNVKPDDILNIYEGNKNAIKYKEHGLNQNADFVDYASVPSADNKDIEQTEEYSDIRSPIHPITKRRRHRKRKKSRKHKMQRIHGEYAADRWNEGRQYDETVRGGKNAVQYINQDENYENSNLRTNKNSITNRNVEQQGPAYNVDPDNRMQDIIMGQFENFYDDIDGNNEVYQSEATPLNGQTVVDNKHKGDANSIMDAMYQNNVEINDGKYSTNVMPEQVADITPDQFNIDSDVLTSKRLDHKNYIRQNPVNWIEYDYDEDGNIIRNHPPNNKFSKGSNKAGYSHQAAAYAIVNNLRGNDAAAALKAHKITAHRKDDTRPAMENYAPMRSNNKNNNHPTIHMKGQYRSQNSDESYIPSNMDKTNGYMNSNNNNEEEQQQENNVAENVNNEPNPENYGSSLPPNSNNDEQNSDGNEVTENQSKYWNNERKMNGMKKMQLPNQEAPPQRMEGTNRIYGASAPHEAFKLHYSVALPSPGDGSKQTNIFSAIGGQTTTGSQKPLKTLSQDINFKPAFSSSSRIEQNPYVGAGVLAHSKQLSYAIQTPTSRRRSQGNPKTKRSFVAYDDLEMRDTLLDNDYNFDSMEHRRVQNNAPRHVEVDVTPCATCGKGKKPQGKTDQVGQLKAPDSLCRCREVAERRSESSPDCSCPESKGVRSVSDAWYSVFNMSAPLPFLTTKLNIFRKRRSTWWKIVPSITLNSLSGIFANANLSILFSSHVDIFQLEKSLRLQNHQLLIPRDERPIRQNKESMESNKSRNETSIDSLVSNLSVLNSYPETILTVDGETFDWNRHRRSSWQVNGKLKGLADKECKSDHDKSPNENGADVKRPDEKSLAETAPDEKSADEADADKVASENYKQFEDDTNFGNTMKSGIRRIADLGYFPTSMNLLEHCPEDKNRLCLNMLEDKVPAYSIKVKMPFRENGLIHPNVWKLKIARIITDATTKDVLQLSVDVINKGLMAHEFSISVSNCPQTCTTKTSVKKFLVPNISETITFLLPLILDASQRHKKFKCDLVVKATEKNTFFESAADDISRRRRAPQNMTEPKQLIVARRSFMVDPDNRCFCVWDCSCHCVPKLESYINYKVCQKLSHSEQSHAGLLLNCNLTEDGEEKCMLDDDENNNDIDLGNEENEADRERTEIPVHKKKPEDTYDSPACTFIHYALMLIGIMLLLGLVKALLGLCFRSVDKYGYYYVQPGQHYEDATKLRRFFVNFFFFIVFPFLFWSTCFRPSEEDLLVASTEWQCYENRGSSDDGYGVGHYKDGERSTDDESTLLSQVRFENYSIIDGIQMLKMLGGIVPLCLNFFCLVLTTFYFQKRFDRTDSKAYQIPDRLTGGQEMDLDTRFAEWTLAFQEGVFDDDDDADEEANTKFVLQALAESRESLKKLLHNRSCQMLNVVAEEEDPRLEEATVLVESLKSAQIVYRTFDQPVGNVRNIPAGVRYCVKGYFLPSLGMEYEFVIYNPLAQHRCFSANGKSMDILRPPVILCPKGFSRSYANKIGVLEAGDLFVQPPSGTPCINVSTMSFVATSVAKLASEHSFYSYSPKFALPIKTCTSTSPKSSGNTEHCHLNEIFTQEGGNVSQPSRNAPTSDHSDEEERLEDVSSCFLGSGSVESAKDEDEKITDVA